MMAGKYLPLGGIPKSDIFRFDMDGTMKRRHSRGIVQRKMKKEVIQSADTFNASHLTLSDYLHLILVHYAHKATVAIPH